MEVLDGRKERSMGWKVGVVDGVGERKERYMG